MLVVLWLLCAVPGRTFAGQIFVDGDAAGANNGSSWADAFGHLRDAISAASSGDEIRVAQGVYRPDRGSGASGGSRGSTFSLIDNITIRGGYAGFGEPAPDARNIARYETILSGDLAGNDAAVSDVRDLPDEPSRSENCYNVVTGTDAGETTVLDGLTITGGNANGTRDRDRYGGGLHNGNVTVINCRIAGNCAINGGGGIGCYGGGTVRDSTITVNCAGYGGGIYGVERIVNCTITGNWATGGEGGGIYMLGPGQAVTNCTIGDNSASDNGGGVFVDRCDPVFSTCTFSGNWAGLDGGGISVMGGVSKGRPVFRRCRIVGNTAGRNGGAVYNYGLAFTSLSSCVLTGNIADGNGGGLYEGLNAGSSLVNCTFIHNSAGGRGGGICYDSVPLTTRAATNCIAWYNADSVGHTAEESQLYLKSGPAIPLRHCCIQGWSGGYVGTIGDNPLFADSDGVDDIAGTEDDNLRLQDGSACVDSGDNSAVERGSRDVEGQARIIHGVVDIGAYESAGGGLQVRPRYEVIDLGTLGGSQSRAYGINEAGRVVGYSETAEGMPHAFMWDENVGMVDLGTLGGAASTAYAVNNLGQVVGSSRTGNGQLHAFLWDKGVIQDLGILSGGNCTEAAAINDSGQVVGMARTSASIYSWQRAFLWENGVMADLGVLEGASHSSAADINIRGRVVGTSGEQAFLWDSSGGMRGLTSFPSRGNAINDSGLAVLASGGTYYLRDIAGGLFDMNLVEYSRTNAINDSGLVVGDFDYLSVVDLHAFLWDSGCGMMDLNNLMGGGSGWKELFSAADIDNSGRIVGYGLTDQDQLHAFLMRPIPADACLIAHWKLDEASGGVAEDSAGGNDGLLAGSPEWQPYSGRVDGALSFDGAGDYVDCGNDAVLDITESITVAAWVNINVVNVDWQAIVAKGDSAWRLSTAEDEMRFHFAVTGGPPWNYVNGDIEVGAGEWHHVCGTYDGDYLRLYVDGVEDSASPVAESNGVNVNDFNVYIGANEEREDRNWDGLIDDVRIYDCPLTAGEIYELFMQAPIYVDGDAPGAKNGRSWADAFENVQDALTAAARGNLIHVAAGVYEPDRGATVTPGDRTATFRLIDDVALKGGFAGYGEPSPTVRDYNDYETVLSGDLAGDDGAGFAGYGENSYHVVSGGGTIATALLEGFTIRGGNAERLGGGGMRNLSGSPTVRDCVFRGNTAGQGGGMYNELAGPTVVGTRFEANRAFLADAADDPRGGAMYNYKSNPVLENCVFAGNSATATSGDGGDAGGIFCGDSSPTLVNCVIRANTARRFGGGMACWWGGGATIVNCVFNGNSAGDESGGLDNFEDDTRLINCTFSGNTSASTGGMHNEDGEPLLVNCIFQGNEDGGGDVEGAQIRTEGPGPVVSYSCVEGWSGLLGGEGNIGADAIFADADGADNTAGTEDDDLRIEAGSPCVDAGDNGALAPFIVTDLDGKARISGGVVDMGAYEHHGLPCWYVDGENGDDSNNGTGPSTAFKTIGKGIKSAREGYTVVVYPGVYREEVAFEGKAITVTGEGSDATILEAPSGYAVSFLSADPNSVLKNVVIRNCGIAGIVISGSSPTITNVTVVDNKVGILKLTWGEPDISNSIFWGNENADLVDCTARYSCIERSGEAAGGEGNISLNPMFVDGGSGDYHLRSQRGRYRATTKEWILDDVTSPCVDGGDPSVEPSSERMPNGARLNMGAFGRTYYASMSAWPIAGDVNRDGILNMADFAIVAEDWLLTAEWAK